MDAFWTIMFVLSCGGWMLVEDLVFPWLHCWRTCPAHKFKKGE